MASEAERQQSAALELDRAIGYVAARTGHAFQRALARRLRSAGHDLTVEEWRLLRTLWRQDGVPQAALVATTLKDKAQVSRMLTRLEHLGLIRRATDQTDRRASRVHLTACGRRLEAALLPLGVDVRRQAIAGIDPTALAITLRTLQDMHENLARENAP